jgi:hypothetical protein
VFLVLNYAYRLVKVSPEGIYDECLVKMKPKNMFLESAPMKDHLSVVPALSGPDDVWLLSHIHLPDRC